MEVMQQKLVVSILAVAVLGFTQQLLSAATFAEAVIIRDHVVFYRTNEVSTTRATLVIDFSEFDYFMSRVALDIRNAKALLEVSEGIYMKHNKDFEAFKNTIQSLSQEIGFLENVKESIKIEINQISSMGNRRRRRRSMIPFLGSALSWLTGTLTEADLRQVNNQIAKLTRNQNRIVHVVEHGLTIINESRKLIYENRQSVIEIIGSLRAIDETLTQITHELEQKINENRRFIEVFARLDLLTDEIKLSIQNARFFLNNIQSQLDYLTLGKLSARVINPSQLRNLLLEIQEIVPGLKGLISDPKTDIWSFYRYLTTTTVFLDGKIMIILSIPLIRLDDNYEVYKVLSVPIVAPVTVETQVTSKSQDLLASYRLEANGFLIDKKRSKYRLLSEHETLTCSVRGARFCMVYSPVYPVSLSKTCLINLFVSSGDTVKQCITQVIQRELPIAQHLIASNWVIVSRESLTFSFVCTDRAFDRLISSPVDIMQVENECVASNKYFTLFEPFVEGKMNSSQKHSLDLKTVNFSSSILWKQFQDKYVNMSKIVIPENLNQFKDLQMDQLFTAIDSLETIELNQSTSWTLWEYVSLALTVVIVSLIILVCLRKHKKLSSCLPNCLRKVSGVSRQNAATTDVVFQAKETSGKTPPAVSTSPEQKGVTGAPTREQTYPYLLIEETKSL